MSNIELVRQVLYRASKETDEARAEDVPNFSEFNRGWNAGTLLLLHKVIRDLGEVLGEPIDEWQTLCGVGQGCSCCRY